MGSYRVLQRAALALLFCSVLCSLAFAHQNNNATSYTSLQPSTTSSTLATATSTPTATASPSPSPTHIKKDGEKPRKEPSSVAQIVYRWFKHVGAFLKPSTWRKASTGPPPPSAALLSSTDTLVHQQQRRRSSTSTSNSNSNSNSESLDEETKEWLYAQPMNDTELEAYVAQYTNAVGSAKKSALPPGAAGALRMMPAGMARVMAHLRLRRILFTIREELYGSVEPTDHVQVWVPTEWQDTETYKITLPDVYDPLRDSRRAFSVADGIHNITAFLEVRKSLFGPVLGFPARDFFRFRNKGAPIASHFPSRLYPVAIRVYAGEMSPHFGLQVGDKEVNVQNGRYGFFLYSDKVGKTTSLRSQMVRQFRKSHRHLYDDVVCYLSQESIPHANNILNKAIFYWLKGGWSVDNNCHDFSLNAALLMCQNEAIRIPSMLQQSFINGVKNTVYKQTVHTVEAIMARRQGTRHLNEDGGGVLLHPE